MVQETGYAMLKKAGITLTFQQATAIDDLDEIFTRQHALRDQGMHQALDQEQRRLAAIVAPWVAPAAAGLSIICGSVHGNVPFHSGTCENFPRPGAPASRTGSLPSVLRPGIVGRDAPTRPRPPGLLRVAASKVVVRDRRDGNRYMTFSTSAFAAGT